MRTISKYTGKDMQIFFRGVDISGFGRSFEVTEEVDEIDATTYGSTNKEYILGMTDVDSSLEVLDDNASAAARDAVQPGLAGTLVWFPIGSASGNPRFTAGTALVKSRGFSYPYDDVVLMSASLRLSNGFVEDTV